MPVDLAVITVNFFSAGDLLANQRYLAERMPGCRFEWWIVNNSEHARVSVDPRLADHVHILTQKNTGFASGVNAAAARSAAPVLFLANPDLLFAGDLLDTALTRLEQDPTVGLLAPAADYPDGTRQATARRFYTWPAALYARLPGRSKLQPPAFWRHYLMQDDPLDRPCYVDWVVGCASFIRRSALSDGRVFDPRYFLYFEDVDLCMDLWHRGWRVRYDPTLRVTHVHQRESKKLLSPAARHHAISFCRFVQKWNGLPQRPADAATMY